MTFTPNAQEIWADGTNKSGEEIRNWGTEVESQLSSIKYASEFGVEGAGSAEQSAFEALAAAGEPVYLPSGDYYITDRLSLADGTIIFGPKDAIIHHQTADKAHFLASGLSYFAIRGITLKGTVASTGVLDVDQQAAIVVQNTDQFDVEFCTFDTCVGSGVTVSRQGTYVNGGRVRFNRFIKGTGFAASDPWGAQDNAPLQVYQYGRNIVFEGNEATGKWYCAMLIQDQVNDGASRIYGMHVVNNIWRDLSQYGIVSYTLKTLDVSAIADNGSGVFRVTSDAAHNLTDGDKVHLRDCGDASGVWEVDVQTSTTFDLVGSVYSASVSNGEIRLSENCGGYFAGNLIDGVDADREFTVGNQPYGAGFYVQSSGGIVAEGNIFRRTNLNSNSESLAPGSIGINGATGPVTFTGGGIFDSGYHAMSIKQNGHFGWVRIGGGGMIISRCERDSISMKTPRFTTLFDIEIETKADATSGRIVATNEVVRGNDLILRNIVCHDFNVTGVSNFLELNEIDVLTVRGVKCINSKPAAQSFEVARIKDCTKADVSLNDFDGGDSAFPALVIDGVTDSNFRANRIRMQDDGAARPAVDMKGTCTGTVYHRDNDALATDGTEARMQNQSTGGQMHTRAATSSSGGKTRQIGDTIENTGYADTEALFWVFYSTSAVRALTPA